jgi:hypothetical protein
VRTTTRTITSYLTLVPISAILIWWLGFFEPQNRYGELRSKRAVEIEEELGRFGVRMRLFRVRYSYHSTGDKEITSWKPLPWAVRDAVRLGMFWLSLILLLAMLGIVKAS